MASTVKKTGLVQAIIVAGFLIAIAYHYYGWLRVGQLYPGGTFLFVPGEVWGDFQSDSMYQKDFHPYEVEWRGLWAVYPPAAFLLTMPFTQVGLLLCGSLFCGAVLYAVVCGALHLWLVARHLRLPEPSTSLTFPTALVISFMTYPYLVAMDRGNCEFAIYLACLCFFWLYDRGSRMPALACLALAVSAKIYPATFAALLMRDKRWKELGILVAMTAGFTLASMALFHVGPVGLVEAVRRSSPVAHDYMTRGTICVEFSTGVVPFLRAMHLLISTDPKEIQSFATGLMTAWNPIGVSCALGMLVPFFLWRLRRWEQALLLVAIVILIPPRSADYKLLHMYIPLLMFLRDDRMQRGETLIATLFGLMMIPKAYGIIHEAVTWSVVWNPLLLTVLVVVMLMKHTEEGQEVAVAGDGTIHPPRNAPGAARGA